MLKSMTAYSYAERIDGELAVRVEIRTYNNRHFDAVLRLPVGYAGLEEKIKALLSGSLVRGRVELRLNIKDRSGEVYAYDVDAVRARAYLNAAQQLKEGLDFTGADLTLVHLLSVPGVVQPAESQPDIDSQWPMIADVAQEVLDNVNQMRIREGEFIAKDFEQRLELIEKKLAGIETSVQDLTVRYRDKLQARIEALTQGMVEIDPARIAQEAGLLADRSDISEEIVRARSHIFQFRKIMTGKEPAGRKLNFLLQEFNREFNTMGAKVGQAEAAHTIVDIKSEVEKLREQVQNIE